MKKTLYFLCVMLACALFSCQQRQTQTEAPVFEGNYVQDSIFIVQLNKSDNAENLYLDIKILDPNGKKIFFDKLNCGDFTVVENYGKSSETSPVVDSVIDIREKKIISDQISMLFLVDRSGSISQDVLRSQYDQIANMLDMLPNTKMYLSFMDSTLTESIPISKSLLKEHIYEFTVREGTDVYLYKAILAKMEELARVPATHYAEVRQNPDLQDSSQKVLFVFEPVDQFLNIPIFGFRA